MEFLVLFQSIWTVVVMIVFLSIVWWAYSNKRQPEFEETARLPLEDDDSVVAMTKEKTYHV